MPTVEEYFKFVNDLNNEARATFGPAYMNLGPDERFHQKLDTGNGGAYWVTNTGGVWTSGNAQFLGSYLGLAPEQRQGSRVFTDIKAMPGGGYILVSGTGETYHFPGQVAPPAPPGPGAPANPSPGEPVAPSPINNPTPPAPNPFQGQRAIDAVMGQFPWLEQVGGREVLQNIASQDLSADEMVAAVRNTEQYKYYTQGFRRADGTLRFRNEAEFFGWRDSMKEVMRQWGRPDYEYDSPEDFAGFAEAEMLNPQEVNDRFEMFDQIKKGSSDTKAAFYVYAGRTLTDEELYEAAINPDASLRLENEYNRTVALQPLDYDTWLTRATEFALTDVVSKLTDLQGSGINTGQAIDSIRQLNPDFARQMGDALYNSGGQPLSLVEFRQAFNAAMIGGAAKLNGMDLPSIERIEEFRQAGVDRAKALEAYNTIGSRGNELSGMAQRAGLGGLNQSELEDALLVKSGPNAEKFRRGVAQEQAAGKQYGSAGLSQSNLGGLQQRGLRTPR